MKKINQWMLAAILICGSSVFTACTSSEDNPVQPVTENATDYSVKTNWLSSHIRPSHPISSRGC